MVWDGDFGREEHSTWGEGAVDDGEGRGDSSPYEFVMRGVVAKQFFGLTLGKW